MNKLNFYGIGPKIGIVLIPWLVVSIVISCLSDRFNLITERSAGLSGLTIAGAILLVFGLIFYFSSVRLLLKGLKEGQLVTKGTFSLCQNPLYMSFIWFLIPAIALMLNSWLVLTSSLIGFILLKVHIKEEYQMLKDCFGDEYLKYKIETPEFIPLPLKKWMKRK